MRGAARLTWACAVHAVHAGGGGGGIVTDGNGILMKAARITAYGAHAVLVKAKVVRMPSGRAETACMPCVRVCVSVCVCLCV
jgi:hypothetical protein